MKLTNDQKKTLLIYITIFTMALSLRLVYTKFLEKNYFFYNNPSSDVTYYRSWAKAIAHGDWVGKEVFYGLPLFPYFLAILDRLFLGNIFLIRIAHLTLGSINCLLLYFLAKKFLPQKIAILAGLLMATNFTLIYYDWLMMPVTLLVFLSLLVVFILVEFDKISTVHERFILGLLIGLLIAGDGKFFIFLFLLLTYFFLTEIRKQFFLENLKFITKKSLPIILGAFLIIFGIAVRNKVVSGDWVLITAQSGLSFYVGNNSTAEGVFNNPFFIRPTHKGQDEDQKIVAQEESGKKLTPSEVSSFWQKKALSFISKYPYDYIKLVKTKFIKFFSDTQKAYDIDLLLQLNWQKKFDINPLYLIFPLAFIGSILLIRKKESQIINLVILSQIMFTLIFFLINRHRATILPFLLLYEAVAIFWIIEILKKRNFLKLALAVLTFLFYFLIFKPETLDSKTLDFIKHAKSGVIYENQNNLAKAKEEYYKALELVPLDTVTLFNLGNTYFKEGNIEKTKEFYLKAHQTCAYNVDVIFNLGFIYQLLGSHDLAIEHFQKVLNYQPDSIDALFQLGQIYQKLNQCQTANTYYQTVIEIQPLLFDQITPLIQKCP